VDAGERENPGSGVLSSRWGPGLIVVPGAATAQARPWITGGAHAVAAYIGADPVPGGGSLGEVRLLQPSLMLHAGALRRLRLLAMINLEGLTISQGELAPGDWGEGFVDRRHPHTYVHELLLSADDLFGRLDRAARVSLTAGKGFAPLGTDDPMTRPALRYPVNHHLAQILERVVAIAAARVGPLAGEFGLFNNDEPERPGQWPRLGGRFGDSWSARMTATPTPGLELQGSHARVHSPEHRPGAGTDQVKWSLSTRWSGPVTGHPVYAMAEWARTSEARGFFVFRSLLAEGAWSSWDPREESTSMAWPTRAGRRRWAAPWWVTRGFTRSRWPTSAPTAMPSPRGTRGPPAMPPMTPLS
jgi:hypothetical protein